VRSIGFSTGALALGDFRGALNSLKGKGTDAVELSALRERELIPLIDALSSLDLRGFRHISLHVPSSMKPGFEAIAATRLREVAAKGWLIVIHPDVIEQYDRWVNFGDRLCVENMDKRKPIGQTANQLQAIFDKLPSASFCMDLGHARQVDPTMTEAFLILRRFRTRLKQLHISEVNSDSRHAELTLEACMAFKKVSELIPEDVPVILESRVPKPDIDREIRLVRQILDVPTNRSNWSQFSPPRTSAAFAD
jgi:hypothetical protein